MALSILDMRVHARHADTSNPGVQVIPAEAVEAAMTAWSKIETRTLRGRMHEALEAAAPYMLANCWDEAHRLGYLEGADQDLVQPTATNPYRE